MHVLMVGTKLSWPEVVCGTLNSGILSDGQLLCPIQIQWRDKMRGVPIIFERIDFILNLYLKFENVKCKYRLDGIL